MGGFKNIELNEFIVDAILMEIIDKILSCCNRMVDDCAVNGDKIRNDEEEIRDYLLENYLANNSVRRKVGLTRFLFQAEVREKKANSQRHNITQKILHCTTYFMTSLI